MMVGHQDPSGVVAIAIAMTTVIVGGTTDTAETAATDVTETTTRSAMLRSLPVLRGLPSAPPSLDFRTEAKVPLPGPAID